MSEADFIFRSIKTYQVLLILVVDTRILGCVADSLQEGHFASISPTDYKDTEASIFLSKVIGITVAHGCCGWVKGELGTLRQRVVSRPRRGDGGGHFVVIGMPCL